MDAERNTLSHPDENLLAAFAEKSVTAREREQVLEHLSACSRCRQIVFLAQAAEPVVVKAESPVAPSLWKRPLLWAYGFGLTALVAATATFLWVYPGQESGKRPTPPVAEVRPQPLVRPVPAPEDKGFAAQVKPAEKQKAPANASVAKKSAAPEAKKPEEKNSAEQPQAVVQAPERPLVTEDQHLLQQPPAPVFRRVTPAAGVSGRAPLASGPAALSLGAISSGAMNAELARSRLIAGEGKASTLPIVFRVLAGKVLRCAGSSCTTQSLPDQSEAALVTSRKNLALASDKSGKLFLSHDLGTNWEMLPVQWSGQVLQLWIGEKRTFPAMKAGTPVSVVSGAAQNSSPKIEMTQEVVVPVFTLLNDKGEIWKSFDDGKTWGKEEKK